jgi:hypothetical protein
MRASPGTLLRHHAQIQFGWHCGLAPSSRGCHCYLKGLVPAVSTPQAWRKVSGEDSDARLMGDDISNVQIVQIGP